MEDINNTILLHRVKFEIREEYAIEYLEQIISQYAALLRMNRSIQAEGAYGSIKWNRAYTRARRKGIDGVILEIAIISCGFNLHKYHLKKAAAKIAA